MDRRSIFVHGATQLELTVSSPSWLPGDETIGGSDLSSAGVPASYEVLRMGLLFLTLRFWEYEWEGVLAMLTYGQRSGIITWFPDADEPTSFEVYLETPKMGERITPTRDANFPRVMEYSITLRNADATNPWTPYFADA
jgi:hypothetical protein